MQALIAIFASMKKLWILLGAALLCACQPEPHFFDGADNLYNLENGAVLTAKKARKAPGVYGQLQTDLFGQPQAISFVRVRPDAYGIDILCGEGEQADSTSALCLRYGAVAGINGSYFNMGALTPQTFIKDDGVQVGSPASRESFRTNGTVYVQQNGFSIDADVDTTAICWEAMGSCPILIDEGEISSYPEDKPNDNFYGVRHPRSLVGTDKEGYLWLVVVDGRNDEAAGMTIGELTVLACLIGLTDALNLDGGGSSTLWTLPGGVLNHPCDNGRFDAYGQRRVPNVLALKKGN